jgi:hypothetical protein
VHRVRQASISRVTTVHRTLQKSLLLHPYKLQALQKLIACYKQRYTCARTNVGTTVSSSAVSLSENVCNMNGIIKK